MAKEFAKSFYNSKKWKDCRSSYIAMRTIADGALCEHCHNAPGYIVHHKVTLTQSNINNAFVSLNHANLEYVCKECHDKEPGHFVAKVKPLVLFDELGQVIRKLPP